MLMIIQIVNLLVLASIIIAGIWVTMWLIRRRGQMPDKERRPSASAHDDAGIRDLIASQQYDQAVEIYAAFTGVDTFTAKQAVEDIARTMRLSQVHDSVLQRLEAGDKAGAVEAYQDITGADLAEALAYVDSLESEGGARR